MKKCSKCHETKELTEFCKNKNKKDGLNIICKPCARTSKIIWKKNNEDKIKAYDKIRNQTHKEFKFIGTQQWRYKLKGIYKIISNDLVLYVGQSKQLLNRISKHKSGIKNPEINKRHKQLYYNLQQHFNLEFKIIEETPNHKEREQYWINKLKPKYNA